MYRSADWKQEKHVPAIDCPDKVWADELFAVSSAIGKEVAHPKTTAHHIQWIHLNFRPDDSKFVYQVGAFTFSAHGASADGADKGPDGRHPRDPSPGIGGHRIIPETLHPKVLPG